MGHGITRQEFGRMRVRVFRMGGVIVSAGWLMVAAIGLSGCDKLQLQGKRAQAGTASSASASTTSSAAPIRPTEPFPSRPVVAPSDVVAKVNGKPISRRDLELTLQDLRATSEALHQPWKPLSAEDKPDEYDLHDLLNDLVLAELRFQDASKFGLDRSADVQYRFWHRFRGFFAQEWVNRQLEQLTVTQAEIDQFYNANKWGFREPERLRVRQIVVSSEDQAKAALVKLLEGVDFVLVAQQMSMRPEAAKGDLVEKWVMRSGEKAAFAPTDDTVRDLKDATLEQAAFAIDKVGGVSSYVKGADGNYHIFQLVERKAGRERPLLEVSDNIRNFLRLQKLAEKTEELRKNAQIEQFPEVLKNVQQ